MTDSDAADATGADHGRGRRRALVIGGVAVALLLVAGVAAVALRSGGDEPATTATPSATAPATGGATADAITAAPDAGDPSGDAGDGAVTDDAAGDGGTEGDGAGTDPDASQGSDAGAPVVDDERAASAACSLAGPELAELTRIAGSGATVESLRDGIGVLDARLQDLSTAAQGRPELGEVVDLGQELEDAWRDAVAADDAGDGAARAAALGRAAGLQQRVGSLASDAADCD